jgi:GGDEF domain-containing protein
MSEPFRETITDSITRSRTLQGVIISGPNGEYAFERDRGTSIAWTGDSPYFKPRFGISKEPFFQGLRTEGLRNVTLSAVYTYIDYDFLITLLKRTLLVVLATLCLALFTLIFQFLLTNPPSPAREESPLKRRANTYKEKEKEQKEKEKEDTSAAIDDEFFSSIEKNIEKSSLPEKVDPPVQAAPAPSPTPPKKTAGLYAPRSYIGREAYTKERLTAELTRCTSFGQDLVLMLMELQDTAKVEDSRFRLLADETVKYFLRRDLIFERGEQGITVILPSIDLDQGFAKSQKFHKQLITKYSETFQAAIELYIGLSSRADRSIDTERFIFEASGALKKAKEDPATPIVAFRSDPEKYRAFMAAQNKSYP